MNDTELRFLFDIRDNHQPIEGNEDKIRQYLGLLLSDRDVIVKALREKPAGQKQDAEPSLLIAEISSALAGFDWELKIRNKIK